MSKTAVGRRGFWRRRRAVTVVLGIPLEEEEYKCCFCWRFEKEDANSSPPPTNKGLPFDCEDGEEDWFV
jgi:hypothetical protein